MNFAPKFLPYIEALRIVAERSKVKPGQVNPLLLALNESAVIPELRRNGEWKKATPGEWENLRVWFPNPIVLSHQQPVWDDQIAHTDVRVQRSEIDRLWPEIDTEGSTTSDVAASPKPPSRPKGTGSEQADVPFLDKMAPLVREGHTPTAAAKRVVGDGSAIHGGGTPESKVRRLVGRFKARQNNGE